MKMIIIIFLFFILSPSSLLAYQAFIVFPPTTTELCKTSFGADGICKKLHKCADGMQALMRGIMPTNCGFDGNNPIVCCPLNSEQPNSHNQTNIISHIVTEKKSDGLSERITQREVTSPVTNFICGKRGLVKIARRKDVVSILVVGGVNAFKNSWPWMALLGRKERTSEEFFCSAILINNNFLISAAHCFRSRRPFFVRLGEHDYGPDFGENVFQLEEDVQVDSIIVHPKYEIGKGYHDIALIKLAKSVDFRSEVSPICLPWGRYASEDLVNKNVTVTGWGTLSYGGKPSSILQEVNVTVFNPSVCDESYSTLRDYKTFYPQRLTRENIVCAGDVDGAKDACQGDSGGPMMHLNKENNTYFLSAVISRGFGCGQKDFPGLYAPIRDFETLQWIKATAFPDQ